MQKFPGLVNEFGNKIQLSSRSTLKVFVLLLCFVYSLSWQTTLVEAQQSDDESFYMFNALWFKEDGGAEKYNEYLQAAGPFVAKHGGISDKSYVPEQAIIGEFDADLVFLVKWPNLAAFTGLIQDPGYQAISHLREEAIADSLLIRLREL